MQSKPMNWPEETSVETLPEVFLNMPGSSWPPASGDVPQGTAAAGSWSISRQLTGGNLPGQVRGPVGFSIATGSIDFPQPAGAPLSPWARGGRALSPGGACALYASHGGPDTLSGLQLGQFVIAPIDGANTSNSVHMDLDENSIRLKRPFTLKWDYTTDLPAFDAGWVLSEIAYSGGYNSVPVRGASTILDVPLVGHAGTRLRGNLLDDADAKWASRNGLLGIGAESRLYYRTNTDGPRSNFNVSAMVAGSGLGVHWGGILADIRPDRVILSQDTVVFATITLSEPTTEWRAIRLLITRLTNTTLRVWTGTPAGPNTLHGDFTMPSNPGAWDYGDIVEINTRGSLKDRWGRGVQIASNNTLVAVPFTLTAKIEGTGSLLRGIFDINGESAWTVAQNIAAATIGAVWVSEDGVFTYRNRHSLRDGVMLETVEALDSLESLDWKIDPSDVADRVEFTYAPTEVVRALDSLTIWEATEPLRVDAFDTAIINVTIEGTTDRVSGFMNITNLEYPVERFSRWGASFFIDGGGDRPDEEKVIISAKLLSPTRVQIKIRNRHDQTLWMVDGFGNPCLILRTSLRVTPGEESTISTGADEEDSLAPLQINASAWVQSNTTAQEISEWVSSQTSRAQATVEQVRVKPDLARQLGDLIRLTDGHTGLRSKAIITGVSLSGDENGYSQHLDLGLLDLTFGDLDRQLASMGIHTFAHLDSWLASSNINTFDQFDDWLIDFGGNL